MAQSYLLIPPAPKDDFVSVHVYDNSFGVYFDSDRGSLQVPEPADIFAENSIQTFLSAQIGRNTETGAEPGIFWVEGHLSREEIKKNYAEQLTKARLKQNLWFGMLVQKADLDWAKTQQVNHISDLQRKAAEGLNLEREWLLTSATIGQERCPACSYILPNPVPPICMNCKMILDEERASKLKFAKV